ncbi:MAG: phosphatidylglycerophosphatase C [Sodalis sp. Fse]|nr:MAG: phosphatidylglycerophosphatase C [Sodalis sp. Fse]
MINSTVQRVVFFDLDGTLHQQDMFGCFLRYLLRHLPFNLLLVFFILPVVGIGLLVKGRSACWPMSLLLWSITFGHSEMRLQALQTNFVEWFRERVTRFPDVQQRLDTYLASQDAQVWLITGSPESLVEKVYHDAIFLPQVRLIGSQMHRCHGGWMLSLRCLGHEKVLQLERELGIPLKLYSGYSDSIHDSPLLYFCQYRWRVTHDGQLKQLD